MLLLLPVSGFFAEDDVVKGYDSAVAGRIWSYIKKYKKLAALTAAALFISTLGELAVPVLEQRLIDRAIVPRFLKIDSNKIDSSGLSDKEKSAIRRLIDAKALKLNSFFFLPEYSQIDISQSIKNKLTASGALDGKQWYVFISDGEADTAALLENRKSLFMLPLAALPDSDGLVARGTPAAIRSEDLSKLSAEEKKIARRNDLNTITVVVLALCAIMAFIFGATFLQTWSASLAGQKVMRDIRTELYKKTIFQSTAFLSSHPIGRMVTRLTGDVETINEFFTSVMVAFLKDFSIMAGVIITLFFLSPVLALVVAASVPLVLLMSLVNRRLAREAFRRQRTAHSEINAYFAERLAGINIVQLFRKEKKSCEEYRERNQKLLDANVREITLTAVFRPAVEFISTIITALVIAVGAKLLLDLQISLGVLIAFISLTAMFYGPVMDIAEKYTILQSAMAGGERVFALLDVDERIKDYGKTAGSLANTNSAKGLVEFRNVCFSYKPGEQVIRNLSFKVESGEKAAIAGYTGAGKTTISNILTRLWDIDSGEIMLDGVNIKDIPLDKLRRSVLPVLQDVFLFSGTIRENIALGKNFSNEEIEEAARAVCAGDFIQKLPHGYETVLSEGAGNISSGQRQLISFARVIAHNPHVVVLDEATSSIDTETEQLIQLGIEKILKGRTSIVIAHRLSTIRNSDKIFVLSRGALVEEGCHDSLMEKNGLYASLYKLQFEQ